jgi:transcription elongation factor GreB
MSRYRPPRPRASPYITPAGHARLTAELKQLWKVTRPEVTRKVSEAAAMGDRSENAEYIYGKKQLREIDARVRYLSKRLEELQVIDRPPGDRSRVFFGAWVTVVDESGAEHGYRIVGPDEIGDRREYISIDSPMARALIGKRVGDTLILERAETAPEYEILDIRYEPPTESAAPAV